MIPFAAKYDLSCLAVLVNCASQHDGKVISKKEKPICQYLTIAEL